MPDLYSDQSLRPTKRNPVAMLLLLLLPGVTACATKPAETIAGRWQAAVLNKAGDEVAFILEVKQEGDQITGALVNGEQRTEATGGSFDGRTLKLQFDYFDGVLTATLDNGELRGDYTRPALKKILRRELRATRARPDARQATGNGKDVSGDWVLRVGEPGQQRIWRAAFRQQGNSVTGTILPISGDWGTMSGRMENGQLTVSHFNGADAHLFKARLTEAGMLEGMIDSERKVIAERAETVAKDVLAAAPDPNAHVRMKNPTEAFRFSFPDAEGKVISSADEQFRNKVVIVTLMGSWCPNCHNEAPFLNGLYDRYQAQGLEIVGLSFEYTGDVKRDSEQLKIFANRHKVKYPLLLAGTTEESDYMSKLPQLTNLGIWPTTLFIGRDGRVKKIHAGFEGPAAGERFVKLKAELEELVTNLLAGTEPGQ